MSKILPILMTDFYKWAHMSQYDPKINKLVSYGTPRGCRLPNKDYVVNFGVQAFCKEYLIEYFDHNFFRVPGIHVRSEITEFLTNCLPGVDVKSTVDNIMKLHELGYLPLSIRTIPEGGKVALGCPNVEIVTTMDGYQWIGGYIESLISSYIWKPMIDATVGHWYREIANKYYEKTADNWKTKARSAMSEFGFRGADSPESGIHSGAGWLLSFDKTATCAAIPWINKMYNVGYPGSTVDVTEYFEKYKNDSLDDFMKDNKSWHSCQSYDEVTEKYITALPYGYDRYPDWLIPDEIYEIENKLINGKPIVYNRKDKYHLQDIDECIVGKGLISTEHSVMCSATSLYMEEIKNNITDVTSYFNKYLISKNKIKFLSDVRDYWNNPNTSMYEDEDWIFPRHIWEKEWFRIENDLIKYSSTSNKFWKANDENLIQEIAETKFVKKLLTEIYPDSSFSMVSDSYDYWRMVTDILPTLKNEVINHNGTLFVRGDSGNPVKIVSGYVYLDDVIKRHNIRVNVVECQNTTTELNVFILDLPKEFRESLLELKKLADHDYVVYRHNGKLYRVSWIDVRHNDAEFFTYETVIPEHELKGTVECLWDTFGGTMNSKGYKVLNSHVRAIYGDSITQERQKLIYQILELKGFSVENVALGAGSFSFHCYQDEDGKLYPYTRDTYNWAQKATYGEYDSHYVGSSADGNGGLQHYTKSDNPLNIYKDPKTDSDHFKKSMKGCCAVYTTEMTQDGNFTYYLDHDELTLQEREDDSNNRLVEIFRDGVMTHEWTFSEIRNNLNNNGF